MPCQPAFAFLLISLCLADDRQPVTDVAHGRDRVCLTSTDVTRVSPDGKILWKVPFNQPFPVAGGGLLPLQGGDMLAFRYGPLWNSGIDLIRFAPATGKVIWVSRCAALPDVNHSKYSHAAVATIEGDTIRVSSRGSHGTFIELLDLNTGKQLKRTVSKRE